MPLPSTSELELAAKKIVWAAKKNGNLSEFTPRLIRQTLEKEYSLDEAALDEGEYKSAIKSATKAALNETPPATDSGESPRKGKGRKNEGAPRKKRKSNGTVKGEDLDEAEDEENLTPKVKGKGKAKAKAAAVSKDGDEDEEEGGSARKKQKTAAKKKKAIPDVEDEDEDAGQPAKPAPRPKSGKKQADTKAKFKSSEHVPTSDMEQDEPDPEPAKASTSKSPDSKTKSPMRRGQSHSSDTNLPNATKVEALEDDEDVKMEDPGTKSESELSVLDDEPPKKKKTQKSKAANKEPKKVTKPRTKKEAPALSKDEETIKRLKGLVVACGTRKVWSRVFEGLETPQQQIKKLKEMLADLGMTGRLSMEQAKAIKEKREFEQELEDVTAFAKAMESRPSRKRNRLTKPEESESEKEDKNGSTDDEDNEAPKQKANARKSIMSFLQDQSSDED